MPVRHNVYGSLFKNYFAKAKALIHPVFKDPIAFVVVEALCASTSVLASSQVGASGYPPKKWKITDCEVNSWEKAVTELG